MTLCWDFHTGLHSLPPYLILQALALAHLLLLGALAWGVRHVVLLSMPDPALNRASILPVETWLGLVRGVVGILEDFKVWELRSVSCWGPPHEHPLVDWLVLLISMRWRHWAGCWLLSVNVYDFYSFRGKVSLEIIFLFVVVLQSCNGRRSHWAAH